VDAGVPCTVFSPTMGVLTSKRVEVTYLPLSFSELPVCSFFPREVRIKCMPSYVCVSLYHMGA
jgi:hypothetical protein